MLFAPVFIEQRLNNKSNITKTNIKRIINKIHNQYEKDKNEIVGNQNCMLCTWSFELMYRGRNILPRPVYSPRDIIFTLNGGENIIKNPIKKTAIDKKSFLNKMNNSNDGARFYVHVNWNNSNGGHEFLIIKIDNELYLVDPQSNLLQEVTSFKASEYLDDVNYNNSYFVRIDKSDINEDVLKYNNRKYLVQWKDSDIELL